VLQEGEVGGDAGGGDQVDGVVVVVAEEDGVALAEMKLAAGATKAKPFVPLQQLIMLVTFSVLLSLCQPDSTYAVQPLEVVAGSFGIHDHDREGLVTRGVRPGGGRHPLEWFRHLAGVDGARGCIVGFCCGRCRGWCAFVATTTEHGEHGADAWEHDAELAHAKCAWMKMGPLTEPADVLSNTITSLCVWHVIRG